MVDSLYVVLIKTPFLIVGVVRVIVNLRVRVGIDFQVFYEESVEMFAAYVSLHETVEENTDESQELKLGLVGLENVYHPLFEGVCHIVWYDYEFKVQGISENEQDNTSCATINIDVIKNTCIKLGPCA